MAGFSQGMFGWRQTPGGHLEPVSKIWIQRIAIFLLVSVLLLAAGLVMHNLMTGKVSTKKQVTTIKIMPDTPPPPPPREPPKEQPRDQPKEINMEQPKPQDAPQPPAEELKMEGAAGDGPSPFAAGTVNSDYKGGKIGGKGAAAFAWYTDQIKARIEEALAAQKELAKAQYRVVVHVWLTRDGRVERTELQGSSGDPAIDKLIRKALAGMGAIAEALPEDMPQPVKLRITSKNAG